MREFKLPLKSLNTRWSGDSSHELTALGARRLFFADDGTHGTELWDPGGTQEGTLLVKDIRSAVH